MKLRSWLVIMSILIPATGPALASGSLGASQDRFQSRQRQVDPVYDQGKAVLKGKVRDYGKIKYCVADSDSGELGKLRGKTLKPYRGATVQELASNLYNCEDPDQLIASMLTRDDLIAVLYYLNKRHKLNLNG